MLTEEERELLFELAEANGVTVSRMVEMLLVVDRVNELVEDCLTERKYPKSP